MTEMSLSNPVTMTLVGVGLAVLIVAMSLIVTALVATWINLKSSRRTQRRCNRSLA